MSGQYEQGDREKVQARRDLERWPSLCPVCHAKRGEHCVTASGKRQALARPQSAPRPLGGVASTPAADGS